MEHKMFVSLRNHVFMKAAVWLVAAMLFHSPAASARCACPGEAGSGGCCASERQATSETPQGRGCCSRRTAQQRTRSCCDTRRGRSESRATTELVEACRCGTSCSCSRQSAPAPPVFPPIHRDTLTDQLALMLADSSAQSVGGVELPRSATHRHCGGTAPATSLQRCIDLSRFTL